MIRRSYGSVAHLGERLHGMEEVASSILVGSTKSIVKPREIGAFLSKENSVIIDNVS